MGSTKSKSFASTVNNWKMAAAGYDKHASTLGFAKAQADQLKALADEVSKLNIIQEQKKADLNKTTDELKEKVKEGNKLRASIIRFAQGQFGRDSLELKDFKPTGEL